MLTPRATPPHIGLFKPPSPPRPSRNRADASAVLDALIAARQAAANLQRGQQADRLTLLRRLSFDLVGLPPTFAEAHEFIDDERPDAYQRLVDRLLASPRFGERWARLWMDVSRYSDTKGYVFTEDRAYPNAYRYREWLIAAFNRDLPFDVFLKAQLAADRMQDQLTEDDLWAMGYLTLGRLFLRNRHDIIDDRIDVVTRGMMGLTVTCARCHDHKYDPIPAHDYYALYGIFDSSQDPEDKTALWLVDSERPHDSPILVRGSPGNRGPIAPRRFLTALAGEEGPRFDDGSGRLQLAEAIASRDNPLTARVWVNRVWGGLFGQFLVGTPSDFGLRCDPPAIPEALDYLALRFMDDGWSHKSLVRTLVLSETYKQSSETRSQPLAVDPENQLLWRQQRKRLQFEQLRDALLLASGELDAGKIGGASVNIVADPPAMRRSLYAHIDRQNLPGLFRTFDFASPDTHAPRRYATTVPQQALFLMNNPFALQAARALADRAKQSADGEVSATVQLYRLALARDPDEQELRWAREFLAGATSAEQERAQRFELLAQVLLESNEFSFLD